MFYIPFITKSTVAIVEQLAPCYGELLFITLLMAHRAQVSIACASVIPKDQVLQLESLKWNAKLLANHKQCKMFLAKIAVAETLAHEKENLAGLSVEESSKYLNQVAERLANEAKPKNARVIPPAAINPNNLNAHRHGKVAQYIGLAQAKPVFEPNKFISGISIANLDPKGLLGLFEELSVKLNITPPNDGPLAPSTENKIPENGLILYIHELLGIQEGQIHVTFDDAINLGSESNLLPLETLFGAERPISHLSNKNKTELSETDKSNPFLVAAVQQENVIIESIQKKTNATPKAKSSQSNANNNSPQAEPAARNNNTARRTRRSR